MKLLVPQHSIHIQGFSLEIEEYPDNLAVEGMGDEHLYDSYLLAIVESDGSNLVFPYKGEWGVYIVKQKHSETLHFPEDVTVASLPPRSKLDSIITLEDSIAGRAGIWVFVNYQDEDAILSNATLLHQYGSG